MITIDVSKLNKGLDKLGKPARTVAALAGTSEGTLAKLKKGETNLTLSVLERVADLGGYDVKVTFIPKPPDSA